MGTNGIPCVGGPAHLRCVRVEPGKLEMVTHTAQLRFVSTTRRRSLAERLLSWPWHPTVREERIEICVPPAEEKYRRVRCNQMDDRHSLNYTARDFWVHVSLTDDQAREIILDSDRLHQYLRFGECPAPA